MSEKMKDFKEIYNTLKSVPLNGLTKRKQKLNYLPWSSAYNIIASTYSNFSSEIVYYDGKPYFYDDVLGYMVHTILTIEGHERQMRLPVLDGANNSLKSQSYKYQVKEYKNGKHTGQMIDKSVNACNMFDINTAHMRCFVKNAALFGLGIDLYLGDDVGSYVFDSDEAIEIMNLFETLEELTKYYKANEQDFSKNAQLIRCFAERKKQLKDM